MDNFDSTKWAAEVEMARNRAMDESAKLSAADRDIVFSAKKARFQVKDEGLWPHQTAEGDSTYLQEQGVKAACLTREDVIAIAHLQSNVLKRLDRNYNFMWVIIALLVYLAWHVK